MKWNTGKAGAGSCLHKVRTGGARDEHLKTFDQTVYLCDKMDVDVAEYVGLFSGISTFSEALSEISPLPRMLLVEVL